MAGDLTAGDPMDALARVEPVARPLLRAVDDALIGLGAPPDHPIWPLLRRVAATPAEAVAHVAALDPAPGAGQRLRREAAGYQALLVPTAIAWEGPAGQAYAVRAAAVAEHCHDTLAEALRATASYVDAVADWRQSARDTVARALADGLTSAQAVTLRVGEGPVRVVAAADLGAHVLAAVVEVLAEGERLRDDWAEPLEERAYHPPAEEPTGSGGSIRLTHGTR